MHKIFPCASRAISSSWSTSASRVSATMNNEHAVLNHYNLANPYPTAWPAEKDESDGSEDERPTNNLSRHAVRRSKSRYSALERSESDRRSLVPGSQRLRDGQENLVQKDEPDPLGATDSVVRVLRQKGLPVEEDQRLSKLDPRSQKAPSNRFQGTGSFFRLPLFHLIFTYPKFIPMHLHNPCFRVWIFSLDPSTRSLLP